jgi:hypothetical protein
MAQALALRARIVLLCVAGFSNTEVEFEGNSEFTTPNPNKPIDLTRELPHPLRRLSNQAGNSEGVV